MRYTYLFNFYLSKIICKQPEVNKEPTHLLAITNNVKAFPRFDDMACSYSAMTVSASIKELTSQKVLDLLRPSKPSLLENNPNNTRNNMNSQIAN